MDPQSSNDDCYFYYYSSCAKGVDCQFRHCKAALGTEIVCSLWKEGICYRDNCKFRHMESRIQRSKIPCYWENQPGGCRKPHCVFFHTKYRRETSKENPGLILPVSSQGPMLVPNPTMGNVPSDALKAPNYSNVDSLFTNENLSLSPASQPVEPVVVTLDEGEESDAESVSSAPMKSVPIKTDVRTSKDAEGKDFGVKTLEQLRMEKIHRESEHFYKSDDVSDAKVIAGNNRNSSLHEDSEIYFSDYCIPSHEDMQLDHKSESNVYKNFYPPDSSDVIILSNSPPPEENNSVSGVGLRSENLPSIQGDLRSRIKKSMGEQQTAAQEKRTLSLKRKSDTEEDSFDFKIKTLDEIRKEKLKKADETSTTKSPPPAYEITELQHALDNKRKIRKLFRDPFTTHKEEREVQKSLEQKLRIDPIKTIRNGSINGLSAEVLAKDVESPCPKTDGIVKNSSRDIITFSDDEDAIPTNKTKEDSGKSSLCSQNHGTTLKNGNINKAANITLSRKLRPIARNKRTTDPVAAPVQEKAKEENRPTNDSEMRSDTSASQQNISPSDEHMTPAPEKPLVTNMSNDDKPDIENQHLLDDKQNVEDQHLPGNIPASSDQQPVLGDEAPPVESTSIIEQKVEPMNIVAERSTSVDDFDNLFLNDSDMMLEESEVEHSDKKAEDIFLEIEQMLDS